MKSYATYLEEARQTHGLLSIDGEGVHFESFPVQSPIEQLFPGAKREPDPKVSWFFPRSEIVALTDLGGRIAAPKGVWGRILRALHVEPNGLILQVERAGARSRLTFDCAVSVYDLLAAYG